MQVVGREGMGEEKGFWYTLIGDQLALPNLFFFLKIGPELTSVANLFFLLLLLLLCKAPQYIVVYSSCRSFWLCYVGRRLSMA